MSSESASQSCSRRHAAPLATDPIRAFTRLQLEQKDGVRPRSIASGVEIVHERETVVAYCAIPGSCGRHRRFLLRGRYLDAEANLRYIRTHSAAEDDFGIMDDVSGAANGLVRARAVHESTSGAQHRGRSDTCRTASTGRVLRSRHHIRSRSDSRLHRLGHWSRRRLRRPTPCPTRSPWGPCRGLRTAGSASVKHTENERKMHVCNEHRGARMA
ncbi:hypothetical protein AURDEDRAFT_183269 [Auricularia subglabra TFB-10046 SS5]|nr:hypothetical protein AURDEDRAFT_183269 [Auricularia subglabra TFB-10046 SS5]